MRISAIILENFTGVRDPVRIDLKPITLLFGPNSAGKSTILQALHYLREILERGNLDPDLTIGGGAMDLGGFKSLVHGHDLGTAIRLKLEVDLGDAAGTEVLPLNSGLHLADHDFSELLVRYLIGESEEYQDWAVVESIAVALEVRWSADRRAPYVSRLDLDLNDDPVCAIVSPPALNRALLQDLNFDHPLLHPALDPYDLDALREQGEPLPPSPLEGVLRAWSTEMSLDLVERSDLESPVRVSLETHHGALPSLKSEVSFGLRDPDIKKVEREERTARILAARALLNELVQGPLSIARDCLADVLYIGPLRQIPVRAFRPRVSPDETRWANGLAAWDRLHTSEGQSLVDRTNDWLLNRLDTGYQVERREFLEMPLPSAFAQLFERGLTEDDLPDLEELYQELPVRGSLGLRDVKTGVSLEPSDVGVGLSQIIPVIVAAEDTRKGLIAIEQPELHVHPAVQVGLGDLFAHQLHREDQIPGEEINFLIETHSEHLMLRLLRRIRETTDQELEPGAPSLTPNDVAVYYSETLSTGIRITPQHIDEDGEFKERWPAGFFPERMKELI